MRITKAGKVDRRSSAAAAQAAAIGPEGRTARAKAGAAARWGAVGSVEMALTVSSTEQLAALLKRLGRRYAWTPDDASHSAGTFSILGRPAISGTWKVA